MMTAPIGEVSSFSLRWLEPFRVNGHRFADVHELWLGRGQGLDAASVVWSREIQAPGSEVEAMGDSPDLVKMSGNHPNDFHGAEGELLAALDAAGLDRLRPVFVRDAAAAKDLLDSHNTGNVLYVRQELFDDPYDLQMARPLEPGMARLDVSYGRLGQPDYRREIFDLPIDDARRGWSQLKAALDRIAGAANDEGAVEGTYGSMTQRLLRSTKPGENEFADVYLSILGATSRIHPRTWDGALPHPTGVFRYLDDLLVRPAA
jgi:hypothetical protein